MRTINVAVIGGGFIGAQHIEAIRRIPGLAVRALVEPDTKPANKLAAELNIPECYSSIEELLEKCTVDVIHNCTPGNMHYPICKMAISQGIHVFCEKPLTLTVEEADELVTLAKEKQVAAGVDFIYRQNAMVQEIRERVRKGKLGKIFTVDTEYLQDWMMYETDYDWRLEVSIGGRSRAVADIGSHCFDMIQFLCGERITEVFANLLTVHKIRKKSKKNGTFSLEKNIGTETIAVKNEDAAYILFRTENGIEGMVRVSQVLPGKKNAFSVSVGGELESLSWNQEYPDKMWIGNRECGNTLIYASPQFLSPEAACYAQLPSGHPIGWADSLKKGIEMFYQSIRDEGYMDGQQSYPTFEQAAYVMRIVEACLSSNETGQWTKVV